MMKQPDTDKQTVTGGQQSPAEVGVWLFILADMVIFAMYFAVFAWDKSTNPAQFVQGQATLNHYLGALNTFILLTSSYFIASAVHVARAGESKAFGRNITLTIVCGLAFLVVKAVEYSEKFDAGFHIASNAFYRDYFVFTGLHMVHVIIGLILLVYLLFSSRMDDGLKGQTAFVEGTGLYWHMVDLLWVVLFALIYLVP